MAGVLIALLRFKLLADDWRGYLVSLFALVLIANVYITVYHLLRVGLRCLKALADRAEAGANTIRQRTVAGPRDVSGADLPRLGRRARRA